MSEKWAYPMNVSDVDIAFGGRTDELLPTIEEIPEEYWGHTIWNKLIEDVFYGRELHSVIHEKEGIDVHCASRHIRAILGSFKPKHEHKMAGCAYLASKFFLDLTDS